MGVKQWKRIWWGFIDFKDIVVAIYDYLRDEDREDKFDSWGEAIKAYFKHKLGYKLDDSVIPKNTPYCYDLFTCPYFMYLNNGHNCCKYKGYIGIDACLSDECKICNVGWPREMTEYES